MIDHAALDLRFPAVEDFRRAAKRRLPRFAFEYLDSGTGRELGVARNRAVLDRVGFMPAVLRGPLEPDVSTTFMGRDYPLPIGMAPVGMSGMIWPNAETTLGKVAADAGIPYGLSSVTAVTPEDIPRGGDLWFQMYLPSDPEVRRDMARRAEAAGFTKLVLTVDVPGESRRERQRRAHVAMPPKVTPSMLISMMLHPQWSLGMARAGMPRMKLAESYLSEEQRSSDSFRHAGRVIRGWPDWDVVKRLREEWSGALVVKGVMEPEAAVRLVEHGVDAIWVSNHSARQSEAAPASITQLPLVREALGPDVPLIWDSGISGGLDILRGLALGADFVFTGRAFHYAIAALGETGVRHLLHVLKADMVANMQQMGAANFDELAGRLIELEA